jgi:TetR/AcrR family transcriptional regulator, cholesterol catabolism regulator
VAALAKRGKSGETSEPRAKRTRDPVGTRRALVDAAIELFGRDGFDATSVQSIVKQANLTKGSFYYHFESKVSLLFEIHERFIDAHLLRIEKVLASDLPGDEMVRVVVRDVIVKGAAQFKAEVTIFYQELPRLTDQYLTIAMRKRDRFENCVVEVVERGIADGSFAGVENPRLAALGMLGMSAFSYHWIDPTRDKPEAIGDYFGGLLLEGLRPRR